MKPAFPLLAPCTTTPSSLSFCSGESSATSGPPSIKQPPLSKGLTQHQPACREASNHVKVVAPHPWPDSMAATAFGTITSETYLASQILDDAAYQLMLNEPLVDEAGDVLMPVRNKSSPHFRRLGSGAAVKDAPRQPRSARHDALITELLVDLRAAKDKVSFFTNYFDDGVKTEKTLVAFPQGLGRNWFSEASIIFPDRLRIRPDLAGSSSTVFAPNGLNPFVIIEVIDTHFPSKATFERLVDLSNCCYIVFFYILGSGKNSRRQKFSEVEVEDGGAIRIRTTHVLIGGDLVVNGVAENFGGVVEQNLKGAMLARLKSRCGR